MSRDHFSCVPEEWRAYELIVVVGFSAHLSCLCVMRNYTARISREASIQYTILSWSYMRHDDVTLHRRPANKIGRDDDDKKSAERPQLAAVRAANSKEAM